MKLTPYTPPTSRSAKPAFGMGLNPFKTALPAANSQANSKALPSEQRFLFRLNGRDVVGGGRFNQVV